MLSRIETFLERLALRYLTRDGKRACLLNATDNALLIRDLSFVPMFATEESQNANLGALYLNALVRVAADDTGTTTLRAAIDMALAQADTPSEVRHQVQEVFHNAEDR